MICVPILATNNAEALDKMARVAHLADLFEARLDLMSSFDVEEIVRLAPRPVIITYRSKKEGGKGRSDYGTRVRFLSRAVQAGAAFLDVEFVLPLEVRHELFRDRGCTKRILSAHLLSGTPPDEDLERLLKRMIAQGSEVVKIVTRAKCVEDNLRVLRLIPLGRRLGVEMIAFCMGPFGRISRIASPLLGGLLTFASLEKGEESAQGQLPAESVRSIMELLTR